MVIPATQLGRRLQAFTAVRPHAATMPPQTRGAVTTEAQHNSLVTSCVPCPRPRSMPVTPRTSQITVPSCYLPKNTGESGRSWAQGGSARTPRSWGWTPAG